MPGSRVVGPDQLSEASTFRLVFDAMLEMVALHEIVVGAAGEAIDYRIVDCNAAFCRITGVSREAAVGQLASSLYRSPAPYLEIYARVAATGAPEQFETHYAPLRRTFRVSAISPGPGTFATISTDVTELRQAVEELQRYRLLFEQSQDIFLFVRRDDGRILDANAAALAAYGYGRAELTTMKVFDLREQAAVGATAEQMAVADERGLRFETVHRRRDGTTFPVEVSSAGVALDGSRVLVSVVRDISERRRAERERERLRAQLAEAQKLESVGRLAGGIAHDFNNILTVVLSCAEGAREALQDGARVEIEDVAEIERAGGRARDLTRQLLAFARRQVVTPVVLDLNEVLRGTERLLRRAMTEAVTLELHLEPRLWHLCCDLGQLEQVILNLAFNARDAMPRGGRLVLETGNCEGGDGEVPAGQHVRLTVHDTGTGMTEEVRRHLFEPFFTTKPRGQGTGLGLATVYGVVSQGAGHIHVRSAPNQGTRVDVYFPRAEEGPAPARPVPALRASGGTETLLVVEDDPQVREVTVRALRSAGYQVLTASDGAEAIAFLAGHGGPIQLLLTDVVMPGADGVVVARAFRQRHPRAAVLLVSGYAQETIEAHGDAGPTPEILHKPFTPSALIERVRDALDAALRPPSAGSPPVE